MLHIIIPTVEPGEPVNEFTEMQASLDHASWVGTGCTRPFKQDDLAGNHKAFDKKEPRD
jgi:hypothetical protein